MKKIFIGLGIFIAMIFMLLIAARLTGMLQSYTIPTPSNHPAIKVGEWVFVTNTKDVSAYKFIVFTNEYEDSINLATLPDFKAGTRYLQRLCGMPGDIIKMKDGVLYVNDKDFDKDLNLFVQYKIISTEYALLEQEDINDNEQIGNYMILGDSAVVTFDKPLLEKYRSKLHVVPFIIKDTTNGCFKWYDKNLTWTPDNFGPLKIPAGCFFVLGDNRHNALDSRYIGFVRKENIKGIVLNK